MFTVANVKTRGLIQIDRHENDGWNCSVLFYGSDTRLTPVVLSTKKVIELFRTLGAPSPASRSDRHSAEFMTGAQLSELCQFGFRVVE